MRLLDTILARAALDGTARATSGLRTFVGRRFARLAIRCLRWARASWLYKPRSVCNLLLQAEGEIRRALYHEQLWRS